LRTGCAAIDRYDAESAVWEIGSAGFEVCRRIAALGVERQVASIEREISRRQWRGREEWRAG
jgi:hypothetical protein